MSWSSADRGVCYARWCGLICLLLFVSPARAPAGITFTSQTRFVDVNTQDVVGAVLPPADRRQDAPDFGPFHGSVSLSFLPGIDQTATQDSTLVLTPDGSGARLDAHGALIKSISDNGLNATSHFQVSFDLSRPEPYHLTYNGREGDPRYDNVQSFVPAQFGGPGAPGVLTVDPRTGNFFDTITRDGTLQPGSFEVTADISTVGFAGFDMTLAIGAPLPPALWAVLTVLPLLWVTAGRPRVA